MSRSEKPAILSRYSKISDMPKTIPLFPLAGALLLPRTDLPLNIYEPRYLQMIDDAMYGERIIGIIQPTDGDFSENPTLEKVGCAGRITAYAETDDGRFVITLTGIARFKIKKEFPARGDYRLAQVEYKPFATDFIVEKDAQLVNRPQLISAFKQYLDANNMSADWSEVNAVSTEVLVNTLSLMAPYPAREKQALLEAPDLKSRADVLVALTEMALAKSGSATAQRMQ
jgi:Lon protease-like protein